MSKNYPHNPFFLEGLGGPVYEAMSCKQEGLGSRLAWRSPAIYANDIGACKIRCKCNVLQVPIQNYTSEGTKT